MNEIRDTDAKILLTGLECLASPIQRQHWDDAQFHFDRVLSRALKITGTRQGHYDTPPDVAAGADPLAIRPHRIGGVS